MLAGGEGGRLKRWAMPQAPKAPLQPFTPYQKLIVLVLGLLQFTIVLDFMILSPLGAVLMDSLNVKPQQFGLVVSAYAFSAGISGVLASGFADRFDRKRLLLVFYSGFILGTLLCGVAPTYEFLLMARIVTGFFAGVVSSTCFAIITDLFPPTMRGRVMGVVMTAFSASQVLGIPAALYLSNHLSWHAPFLMIVGLAVLLGLLIAAKVQPITGHLGLKSEKSPFAHLLHTATQPLYLRAFLATIFLSTGGFMLMPFGSAFTVRNLGLTMQQLPFVYLVIGICTIAASLAFGRVADSWGALRTFVLGSSLTMLMVAIYTHLGHTPIGLVILVNALLMSGVTGRMISSQAIISTIPAPASRGAFMSLNSSIQQVSGGIGASLAGAIILAPDHGPLQRFDVVGFVVMGTTLLSMGLMYTLTRSSSARPSVVPSESHVG